MKLWPPTCRGGEAGGPEALKGAEGYREPIDGLEEGQPGLEGGSTGPEGGSESQDHPNGEVIEEAESGGEESRKGYLPRITLIPKEILSLKLPPTPNTAAVVMCSLT